MGKRVAFKWVGEYIDFDTKEEAEKYIRENQGKGFYFTNGREPIDNDERWSVEVLKPYDKKHNPGW